MLRLKQTVTPAQKSALDSITELIHESNEGGVYENIFTAIEYRLTGNVFYGTRQAANSLSHVSFMRALTHGYELHRSAKEIISEIETKAKRDYYHSRHKSKDKVYNTGILHGIKLLEQNGIKFTK